jgi:hypothetical protein
MYPRFGSRVGRVQWINHVTFNRSNIDYGAPTSFAHFWRAILRHQKWPLEIDRHHAVPIFCCLFVDAFLKQVTSVVYQYIESARVVVAAATNF